MADGRRRRRLMVAGAVGAGVALAGAPKVAAARLRRNDDDPDPVIEPVVHDRLTVPTSDGGFLSALRVGAGPPIVLSHGVTLSARTWAKQFTSLPAAGFEVVAYDHRGHGASGAGWGSHGLSALGSDLRDLMVGLDLRDAVIVGHSMGGIAAQAFLLEHPEVAAERVVGVVLLSTLARVPVGSHATRMKEGIRRVAKRVPDTTPVWRSRDLGLVLARFGFGVDPKPAHLELVRQMILECPVQTRLSAGPDLVGTDLSAALDRIDVPVLVVVGDHDRVTPVHNSRLLAKHIPKARLEVLAGGGHMLMLEQAAELDARIVEFARALAPVS